MASRRALHRRQGPARGRRAVPVRAVLSLGVVVGFGAVGTLAYWTDEAVVSGGEFVAGTLDLKLSGVDDNPPEFASGFALSDMQPGHGRASVLEVQNDGTADFVYTATGEAPGELAPSLRFRVVAGGEVTGTGSAQACSGGTQLFDGTLGATPTGVITAERPLPSGGTESLCLEARMPTGTTTGQGLSTTSVFRFDAKQVGAP